MEKYPNIGSLLKLIEVIYDKNPPPPNNMKTTPNINSLLALTEEIEHLRQAKDLLWELFIAADRGNYINNWALRHKITNYLDIDEDE